MRKSLLMLVFLLLFPLSLSAQEPETTEFKWPALGLTFQHPAEWVTVGNEQFDFVLLNSSEEVTGFIGVQSAPLPAETNLEGFVTDFAGSFGAEVEPVTFGGLEAYQFEFIDEANTVQSLVIGFQPASDLVALLVVNAQTAAVETFFPQAEQTIASAEVTPLVLDEVALDAEILASFEADQVVRLGAADAPVKMVEVLDFSCGHCASYTASINRLIQDYVVTGQVQLEFRFATFVGRDFSVLASNAQYCAASLGFGWQMHETLFDIHQQEGVSNFTVENLNAVVRTFEGVDAAAFETCLNETPYASLIERDAEYLEAAEVSGTPSLLFATGEETPAMLKDDNGDNISGGIRLLAVYSHLDTLLGGDF